MKRTVRSLYHPVPVAQMSYPLGLPRQHCCCCEAPLRRCNLHRWLKHSVFSSVQPDSEGETIFRDEFLFATLAVAK